MARPVDVRQRLREDLVSGAWPFGTRLTIGELASRYGVSHMPVREALRELTGEGLVITEPNRGARVRSVDRTFIENLFEVRSAVEVMLVKRATERRTQEDLRRLKEIQDELEDRIARADFAAVLERNRAFHQVINEVADNPDAVTLIDRHWLLIAALWKRYGYGPERFAGVANDHRHLLRALEGRDTDAAAIIMGAHVVKAKQELIGRMSTEVPTKRLKEAVQ